METLTIHAASHESADALLAAMSAFRAKLLEAEDGRCDVVVSLGGGNDEILAVLEALEQCVSRGAAGPTRLDLGGHTYVMRPAE
jgi:hypothetical protein